MDERRHMSMCCLFFVILIYFIMAFEHGNQLWKVRATHGRDLIAVSPPHLKDAAIEFFEYCIENPLEQMDWQAGCQIVRKSPRPFTIRAFCIFLDASYSWWRSFKSSPAVIKEPGFLSVIQWIEDVMYTQKFEGAAIGMYKENLISRELGLRDGVDMDHTVKGQALPVLANMSLEELKALRDGTVEGGAKEGTGSGD
jgi:hypothetical protein